MLARPPKYAIALLIPVICDPEPEREILVPGSGLAKAQGLNQCERLRVEAAQLTEGFVESGVPPALNGLPTKNVLAPPPGPAGAVAVLGVTLNGFPV